MSIWIQGGTILTPQKTLTDSVVVIEGGRIAAIEPRSQVASQPADAEIIHADGLFVMPGLIDIHIHGSAGCDAMDASAESLNKISSFLVQHGVTSFLPTTISQSSASIGKAIENISQNKAVCTGSVPLGAHLEGPYLCQPFRGAHQVEWLRNPDPQEYRPWLDSGAVRVISLAPELPGALELIQEGATRGIILSAAHTQASPQEIKAAVDAGLRHATHTFNGMAGLHHRDPGTVGALLADDRVRCEVIADGVHVHPEVLKMVVRIKGLENTILVTDAMRATGLSDGEYGLGGQSIHVSNGVARTSTGGLAGSTLTLDVAIQNIQKYSGLAFNQAVRLATLTPAEALGLAGKKGEIRPGADADILITDKDMNVKAVLINGKVKKNFQE